MATKKEAEERLGKTKFIMFTGTGGTAHPTGLMGKRPGWSGGKGLRCGLYCGFGWKGRIKSLGLPSLNNFPGFWDIRVVPSSLSSGPGMIKTEKYCLLGCRDWTEEIMALDWLVCISKACYWLGLFLKNCLASGGTVTP